MAEPVEPVEPDRVLMPRTWNRYSAYFLRALNCALAYNNRRLSPKTRASAWSLANPRMLTSHELSELSETPSMCQYARCDQDAPNRLLPLSHASDESYPQRGRSMFELVATSRLIQVSTAPWPRRNASKLYSLLVGFVETV